MTSRKDVLASVNDDVGALTSGCFFAGDDLGLFEN